ncbi:Protein ECERIFERUM 26-like [Linum perenne]
MGTNTTAAVPKPHLEGILTVMPMAVTEPRLIRHVSPASDADEPVGGSGILKGCLNVVLYYTRSAPAREDSGWVAAGWMKESLARALSENPLLGGRLRRGEEGEVENGARTGDLEKLEVVSNDSGARLLEATIPVNLEEFMEIDEKVRAAAEADLVFWKEIDEITPQFSPLFYVQVTNFKCGGYSVGISCSLLLADLILTGNFLQRWGQIQQKFVPRYVASSTGDGDGNNTVKQLPIFYLPNLKLNSSFPLDVFNKTPSRGQALTFILKSAQLLQNDTDLIASLCVNEAQRKVKGTTPDQFLMLEVAAAKESSTVGVLEVRTWRKLKESMVGIDDHVRSWEELRMEEVCFYEGKKPDGSACWVSWPNVDDGFLMASIDQVEGDNVVLVAIPDVEKQRAHTFE